MPKIKQKKFILQYVFQFHNLALAGLLLDLTVAQAVTFPNSPSATVVGEVQFVTAKYEDTLLNIAEEFELGYEELVAANPKLDSWLPGEGNHVILPSKFIVPATMSKGIHINLAEYRLYYFPEKENTVITFPISIGRGGWDTPLGAAQVTSKLVNPAWHPPESIRREHAEEGDPLPRVVPPGPDNPLGNYALQLNLPSYLIHGTNKPYGIGMKATHGCIRLRPQNIASLFKQVSVKTPVEIVWQPFKVGIKDNVIYFEAHPAKSEYETILEEPSNASKKHRASALTDSIRQVLQLADEASVEIDWLNLADIVKESRGIPFPINQTPIKDVTRDSISIVEAPRRSTQHTTQQSQSYIF